MSYIATLTTGDPNFTGSALVEIKSDGRFSPLQRISSRSDGTFMYRAPTGATVRLTAKRFWPSANYAPVEFTGAAVKQLGQPLARPDGYAEAELAATTTIAGTTAPASPTVTQRQSKALGLPARSGLDLAFGMYTNELTLEGLYAIEQWSGVLLDWKAITAEGASGWGDQWSGLRGSGWAINQFADHPARLMYSIPLIPAGVAAITDAADFASRAALQAPIYAAIAAGDHDAVWDQRGDDIAALEPNAIVIIGQETNMWKYHGSAMSVEAVDAGFKAAFRRVAQRIKAKAPNAVIAQVIGSNNAVAGYANGTAMAKGLCVDWDETLDQPVATGSRVLDILGANVYDNYDRTASSLAELENALSRSHTLCAQHWYDIAVALDIDFCVPEWGVTGNGDNPGGDDPTWVGLFLEWMRDRERCVMHAYWNNTGLADWQTDLVTLFPLSGVALKESLVQKSATPTLRQLANYGVMCNAQSTTTLVGTRYIPWAIPSWDAGGLYDHEYGDTFTIRRSGIYILQAAVVFNSVGAAGSSSMSVTLRRAGRPDTVLTDMPLPNNVNDWTAHLWCAPHTLLAGDEIIVGLWSDVGDLVISPTRSMFSLLSVGITSE